MGPTDPSGGLTPGRHVRLLCGVGLAVAGIWCLTTPLMAAPRPTLGPESPEPEVRTVAAGLDLPWGLAFLPDGSALVTERDSARVLHVTAEAEVHEVATIDEVEAGGEGGLMGVAVSPDFETDHHVFLYYSTASDNRIVRATFQDGSLGGQEVILDGIPHSGTRHNGGRLAVGPDGMLYATTGDAEEGDRAQDRSSLAGKILRMTLDGEPAEGNPFEGSLVWSYGHRNPQGLAWDPAGRMYASELGADAWDELNRIEPGGNYGWPTHEGPAGEDGEGEGDGGGGDHVEPLVTWRPADASPSDAGYLDGALYVAALRGSRLWRIPLDGDGSAGEPQALLHGDHGRLRAVEPAPDGTLWVTTSNGGGDDQILALTFSDPGSTTSSAPSSTAPGLCPPDPTSTSPSTTVPLQPFATIAGSTTTTTSPGSSTTAVPPCPTTTSTTPATSTTSSSSTTAPCPTTTSSSSTSSSTTSPAAGSSTTTSPGSSTTTSPGSSTTAAPPCPTTTSTTPPSSTTSTTGPACPPGPTSTSSSTTSSSSSTTVTVQPFAVTGDTSTSSTTAAGSSTTTSATVPPCTSSTTGPSTTQAPTTSTGTTGGALARTGSDTNQLVALGVGLLIAGVLLLVSTRRYGSQPVPATASTRPTEEQRPPAPTSIFETWKRARLGP